MSLITRALTLASTVISQLLVNFFFSFFDMTVMFPPVALELEPISSHSLERRPIAVEISRATIPMNSFFLWHAYRCEWIDG